MKKSILLVSVVIFFLSCKKNQCHECHYDGPNGFVEIGEYCNDDLEDIEASGYTDANGNTYEVHCEEH